MLGPGGEAAQKRVPATTSVVVKLNQLSRRATTLFAFFEAMPRVGLFSLVLTCIFAIGVVDSLTGPLVSFAIFYLVPVVLGTWLLGRNAGIWLAVAAGLVWGLADQLGPFAAPRAPLSYWNDAALLAVFLLVLFLVNSLKTTWDYENELLADVQARLLPGTMPQDERYEIAGRWRPAGVVGGDYYDALPLDRGRVALCIADVSGKGMLAALVMSNVQAAVRVLAHDSHSPRELLAHINHLAFTNTRLGTFVTMFYCVLDPGAGTLVFSNAGHNPPILARRDGSLARLSNGGPVLGVFADAAYAEGELSIAGGDRLVLFTDGLSEHATASGEEFGESRLVETVLAHRENPASELCDAIVAAAVAHSGSRFEDDLTLLIAAIG